jgi:hypothetical protein
MAEPLPSAEAIYPLPACVRVRQKAKKHHTVNKKVISLITSPQTIACHPLSGVTTCVMDDRIRKSREAQEQMVSAALQRSSADASIHPRRRKKSESSPSRTTSHAQAGEAARFLRNKQTPRIPPIQPSAPAKLLQHKGNPKSKIAPFPQKVG